MTRRSSAARGALALGFTVALCFQLVRSIYLDAYDLPGTRVDLAGYAIAQVLGGMLLFDALRHRRLVLSAIIVALLLIIYIAVIAFLTAPFLSPLDLMLSRFGVLNWYLLGLGFAGAIAAYSLQFNTVALQKIRHGFLFLLISIGAIGVSLSIDFLKNPLPTISYQAAANGLMILLLILYLSIEILWPKRVPALVLGALTFFGTFFVAGVALLQSTSIVAFWACLLALIIARVFQGRSWFARSATIVLSVILIAWFLNSDFSEALVFQTRFGGVFNAGDYYFNSLENRLGLLPTFYDQFAISPWFGNYSAELLSGAGVGNYLHSLPLSFLTHTGVLGMTLAAIAILLSFLEHPIERRRPLVWSILPVVLLFVLALGTLFTFMTWSVFWFVLGALSVRRVTLPWGQSR
jgi:hypothetical protein